MNGHIIRLAPIGGAAITATVAFNAAFPLTNLTDVQPKVVARSPAVGAADSFTIFADLGADVAVDAVGLLFTNLPDATAWAIHAASAAQGDAGLATNDARLLFNATRSAGVLPPEGPDTPARRHLLAAGAATTVRYLAITLSWGSLPAGGYVQLGNLVIGRSSIAPAWNFEWGGGRRVTDLSERTELPGGEMSFWRKARVPMAKLAWGDMTSAEIARLYALEREIGESLPLLVAEEGDMTALKHEQLHYAVVEGWDFYERTQVDKVRVDLKLRHWL